MNLDEMKAKWASYSLKKKCLIGGVCGFALLGALGLADEMSPQPSGPGPLPPRIVMGPNGQPMQVPTVMGPNGQPMPATLPNTGYPGGYGGGMAGGGMAGGGAVGSGQIGADPDQMRQWEEEQRSGSQQAAAFGQVIRGEDTIRDNDTGQIYGGVDSGAAAAAVDGGAATYVPTSELPVAGDGGGEQ